MDDLNCDASFSWMLATHEAMEIFIIPWDIISTSSYSGMTKWLNATNASITLHTGDSVTALCLIIDALEQQAVPSVVRWMHAAQGGCWITAALQAGWELMGTEPLRLEGTSWMSTASHSRLAISTLLQGQRLHNCTEQSAPMLNHPHTERFVYIQMVFSVYQFVLKWWKWMHKAQAKWRQVNPNTHTKSWCKRKFWSSSLLKPSPKLLKHF